MNNILQYESGTDSDEDLVGPPVPVHLKPTTKESETQNESEGKEKGQESKVPNIDSDITSLKITGDKNKPKSNVPPNQAPTKGTSSAIQNEKEKHSAIDESNNPNEQIIPEAVKEDKENEEEFVGPPVPNFLKGSKEKEESSEEDSSSDEDDDLVGPPVPDFLKANKQETNESSEEETSSEDEGEDFDLSSIIPVNNNVSIHHGSKAVVALAVDPAGARLASGSVDYDVRFWDFAGMDNTLQSFRTLSPCGNNPIKSLNYSATGDTILVVSGMSQAKVLDRDGHELVECVKGDQYVTDMARTKGHIATLTGGCWHPRIKEEFLTSSEDGTCRLWDVKNGQNHKALIKCRSHSGLRTTPTACTYSRDGNLIACTCLDGSIQFWDHRKMFVNASQLARNAHQPSTETSCITFSYGSSLIATRGGDDTLKLWDMKMLKKALFEATNLYSRYATTDCMFSPNDSMLITGVSLKKGETFGKMYFYDTKTFEKIKEVEVEESHVVKTLWHPRLQQIFVGCGNGVVKAYFNEERSGRGAKLCASKLRRKKKQVEVVAAQQIITPHALPMFRQEKPKSLRKKMEKDRLDPVKSRRPDLPIKSGQGGRVAASGSTLSSYVIRNLGLSKRVEDDQDPREAILRFAKEAEENPFWITPAYTKTQPKTIFQNQEESNDETGEQPTKKPKV